MFAPGERKRDVCFGLGLGQVFTFCALREAAAKVQELGCQSLSNAIRNSGKPALPHRLILRTFGSQAVRRIQEPLPQELSNAA